MKLWGGFLAGYREARAARPRPLSPQGLETESEWDPASDLPNSQSDYERLHLLYIESEAELTACRTAVADLAAEAQRLRTELNEARMHGGSSGDGDERFRRLARVAQKLMHPDRAGSDEKLAAMLEPIFKELRAEIEKIERGI